MTFYKYQKQSTSLFEKISLSCCYSFIFLIGVLMATLGFTTVFFLISLTIPETFVPIFLEHFQLWEFLLIITAIISGICAILIVFYLNKFDKSSYLINHFFIALFYVTFIEFLSVFGIKLMLI